MTQGQRFNPPPHWPEPPQEGWVPPTDFRPDRSWGPVPAGWRLWLTDALVDRGEAPLQDSEDVPASGARPRRRAQQYPISVLNPGMWTENPLEEDHHGFPPATPVRSRPRLRLGLTIAVTALGFVLAALTAVLFVLLVDFAVEDLPGRMAETSGHLRSSLTGPGVGASAPDRA